MVETLLTNSFIYPTTPSAESEYKMASLYPRPQAQSKEYLAFGIWNCQIELLGFCQLQMSSTTLSHLDKAFELGWLPYIFSFCIYVTVPPIY